MKQSKKPMTNCDLLRKNIFRLRDYEIDVILEALDRASEKENYIYNNLSQKLFSRITQGISDEFSVMWKQKKSSLDGYCKFVDWLSQPCSETSEVGKENTVSGEKEKGNSPNTS